MPNNSKQPNWLDEILRQLEVNILDIVGEEFAPKQRSGSPERKRLLALIGQTTPKVIEAKAAIETYILTEIIGKDLKHVDMSGMSGNKLDMTAEYNRFAYYGNILKAEQRTALTGQKEEK